MTNSGKRWTKQEIKYLKTYYPKYGETHCAKHLKRTPESIRKKANDLDIISGIPNGYVPLLWITRAKCDNIPQHVIQRARFENALSDIPGRFYRYAVKTSWADKYEEEQRQLDQLDADRADWLTLKQIAHEANLDYRTLIRQLQDNRALGAKLKTIDHYQMRGPGRRYKYHPHQAREAIAQYRKQPKYDLNRSANVLKTLKQVPNATVDELATKLRAKRGTIYATLRNLERKNLVTRTRAPCGPTTRPPDLWQAK